MKINKKEVKGKEFAYDECHKIYILETEEDIQNAKRIGYSIYPIKEIQSIYRDSCPLRFIHTWDFSVTYAKQGQKAIFTF